MKKTKSHGYWRSLDNTISEARAIIDKQDLDRLPSKEKLLKSGKSSLVHAISVYHGGFSSFRKLLEERPLMRPPGLWQDLEYTLSEARTAMKKYGFDRLPNSDTLSQLGYGGLRNAISVYHGGFPAFRKLLKQELLQREKGTWQNVGYVLSEARAVMEKHGFDKLPSSEKLGELGYSGLVRAIVIYHEGFSEFRKLLNQDLLQKELGVWKDLEYTLSQARAVMEKHGFDRLPNPDILSRLGYSSLRGAIGKYHGGFVKFRRLLGEQSKPIAVSTPEQLKRFLEEQPTAKEILSISLVNGYTSDAAHILAREWPERFPSYEEVMKKLPQLVPRIGSALRPISRTGDGQHLERLIELLNHNFSPQTRSDLADVLYRIGLQEYQKPFGHHPKRALARLEQKVKTAVNRDVSQLYRRVYAFYQEVFRFSIPCYGSLATR